MRRIIKGQPPRNVSPTGQQARSFIQAEHDYQAALLQELDRSEFARAEFNRLNKAILRESLELEQRGICVYCERALNIECLPFPPVEHWRPLGEDHDHALHWKNLYLSCPTHETCDGHKKHRRLRVSPGSPDLPWPVDLAYDNLVGFGRGGDMYVRSDKNMDQATREALELAIGVGIGDQRSPSILNLNHRTLVAARKAALDSERTKLEKSFPSQRASNKERAARASQLLRQDKFPAFLSIRVAWLQNTLGTGR